MKHPTYYLRTAHTTLYFAIAPDGTASWNGRPSAITEQKLLDFLAIARELGMASGKV